MIRPEATEIPVLDCSHAETRRWAASGAPIFLPVNPVEFHGPHLTLQNDSIVAHGLLRDVHARLRRARPDWPLLLAPELGLGCGTVPGPGSRNASMPELRKHVLDACRALADLGAQSVVLMTFHGNPMHSAALHAGVRYLERRGVRAAAPMHRLLEELILHSGDRLDHVLDASPSPEARRQLEGELQRDFHAGFLETSLALHYAPLSVDPDYPNLPPCPDYAPSQPLTWGSRFAEKMGRKKLSAQLDFLAHGASWYRMDPQPGYTGSPHLARAEVGAALATMIADGFAELVESVLYGDTPHPKLPLSWLGPLTLEGRLIDGFSKQK